MPAADWGVGEQLHPGFAGGVGDWLSRWPADRDRIVREMTRLAFAEPSAHRHEIGQLVDSARVADATAALEAFTEIARRDFRSTLNQVTVPALLIFGGRSTSTTPWVRSYMSDQLPRATVEVFEDCGHALMLEAPDRFNRVIHEFTSSVLCS